MNVSIGIISHNDTANIAGLIRYFLEYNSSLFTVKEVIVVSTAGQEAMTACLKSFSWQARFTSVLQPQRSGKSAAINEFLRRSIADVNVICSGDIYPAANTLEQLIRPFQDTAVGMTGGRVVTVSSRRRWPAQMDSLVWELHDCMAQLRPKLGEMIAFRNVVDAIPSEVCVDEAFIEHEMEERGLRLRYVPTAVIYNYAETTFQGFIRKRVRINLGHWQLQHAYGYKVSSFYMSCIGLAFGHVMKKSLWKQRVLLGGLALLELYARLASFGLFILRHEMPVWPLSAHKISVNVPALVNDGK